VSRIVDQKCLLEFIRRLPALEAFDGARLDKRELAEAISVSRPTAYRIITGFAESGIIAPSTDGYELTRYGTFVVDAARTFNRSVSVATTLKPLLNSLGAEIGLEPRLFADATITDATYDDPFRPMNRFVEQFKQATEIKAFNKSFLEPMYIDAVRRQIDAGMKMDIIYDPGVLELVLEQYPAIAEQAFESDQMSAAMHDDLPIALAIFADRIGIGIHSESMGTPVSWIDTDNPEAIACGEQLFEQYQTEATIIN